MSKKITLTKTPLQKSVRGKPSASSILPKPLKSTEVYRDCTLDSIKISSTREMGESHEFIAQDRAVKAINLGLGIQKPGYNIYVAGYSGTGKTSVIRAFLEKWSKKSAVPNDWIYIFNFDMPEAPNAIELPAGEAKKFKKKIDNFIRDLRRDLPDAFQSEDYENAINTYGSAANERKSKLFTELERYAKTLEFSVKSSRSGIETVPISDGKAISDKDYSLLDEKQREEIEIRRAKLEPEVLDFARKVRTIDNEVRSYIDTLRTEIGNAVVGTLIDPLIGEYEEKDFAKIIEHLRRMKEYIVENLNDFIVEELEPGTEEEEEHFSYEVKDPSRKYGVNVFIDNSKTKGAPVILETNPSYYNLFGKVEKNVEHGIYQTDFSMIKPGAIHRANGGYLVLNINDIFKSPSIWETLKRVLRNREAFIEDMGEQMSMLPTSGLRPQPIPLNNKVILIGNDEVYHILFEEDEDFHKIFKVKADFDYKMEWNSKNIKAYVSFVATRAAREDLLAFDQSAIAAIVEFSARLVEDQNQLSTQFGSIKDLTIEADYIARREESKSIKRKHVEMALDEKYYRLNLFEEHVYDLVKNEDIILSLSGSKIGQINGLTVYEMGDYAFGKVCRITCTTAISDDGIFNIERASRLSGSSHDKGMYILSGYLSAILARERSLGVSASVCFEQSYGMIDGDSASTAELVAIISAMSEIPIFQNFAITGSVNQMGEIQAIGGVNEKIEGFYKIAKLLHEKKSKFHVIIPHQNVGNLMLHRDVRQAVKDGDLNIYPVKYLWEAFELLTGVELGAKEVHEAKFGANSALDRISKKLHRLYLEERKRVEELHEKHYLYKSDKKVARKPKH